MDGAAERDTQVEEVEVEEAVPSRGAVPAAATQPSGNLLHQILKGEIPSQYITVLLPLSLYHLPRFTLFVGGAGVDKGADRKR